MKKVFFIVIIFVMIILMGVSVYAEYIEQLPTQPPEYPYMFIGYNVGPSANGYILYYSNIPLRVGNYREWLGKYVWDIIFPAGVEFRLYSQLESTSGWVYHGTFSRDEDELTVIDDVVYANYGIGSGLVDLEISENNRSFFGIDFDYSGFFGDLKVQLGKKEESGTYKLIKEWQYPKGSGHVSIPASEIPQGNKGEYRLTIYDGDIVIKQYPYVLNVEKEPYCEINYPVNGMNYDYFPNVNVRYYDMGRLYIYINGEMYKQIQTANREGIEVIEGKNDLFDVGMNTVTVKDSDGQVVATVQYEVLREGLDPGDELPEFEAESWVQELFDRIMNEYSLFFEYVKSMYAFLPVEIVGLVGIIMMLSVILWFTGRK
jgi:hypothetical protein